LDVCVTYDVFNSISPSLDETTDRTYTFSRALQGPVLDMRIRGVLVDQTRRSEVIDKLFETGEVLELQLNRLIFDGLGRATFNWRSHTDLADLFYHDLGIKPIIYQGRPTTNRAARDKLINYPFATMLVKLINTLTELGDKISVLRTAVDPDGRIRTSYNIAGTSTGRFSSSLSEFGTGGNLQNVEESLRSIFIADPGWKFAKCDAKSGESYAVGAIEWNLFNDPRFLDACESGDIHTAVARLMWPTLPWTGDLLKDKALAEEPFYRNHSRRFLCKRIGHGSNYFGKPPTLAAQTGLDIDVIEAFQPEYFRAFPAHRRWHEHVDATLRRTGCLTTLTGRRRWFFGRRNDPSTFREAVAYDPQGSLADIVNAAMLKLWRMGICLIVMHDHDALTFMYKEEDEERIIPILMANLVVPIQLSNSRMLRIPYDCEVGWNKGHYDPVCNPDGLMTYNGPDTRKRQPIRNFLDAIISKRISKA
jgi:DNA polymerase-1